MSETKQVHKSKTKKIPFSYEGYREFHVVKKAVEDVAETLKRTWIQKMAFWKTPKRPTKTEDYEILCGALQKNQRSVMDIVPMSDTNMLSPAELSIIEDKWMPEARLSVYDPKEKRSLTAKEAKDKHAASNRWMPVYYQNPLQSYDYIVYESLIKNTLLGPVMRTLMKFIMGSGFHPELELRMPTGDAEKDKKEIEDNKEIISNLEYVDRQVTEKGDVDGIDISFKLKIQNMIYNMLVFNRSAGVFVYDEENPIMIGERKFPQIPVNIVDFHPRDIGIVKISPESRKMTGVQINQITGMVSTEEMIYFWNSDNAAPIWNAKYYGGSMMMPMINPARIIQTQIQSIWPAISQNMVAGLYDIFIEPQGGTKTQKEAEYTSITEANKAGTANVFMIDPERVKFENINFDPKIAELMQMFEMLVKYILALANVPQIGFFDEAAANHATAVEKIQLTISTVINPMREWIGDEIARQWYNRIFKVVYKDQPEILKKFKIKVAFEDLQVETLKERAEGLEVIERRKKLVDKKAGEILQIDGYEDAIDPDQVPPTPMEEFEVQEKSPMGNSSAARYVVKSRS